MTISFFITNIKNVYDNVHAYAALFVRPMYTLSVSRVPNAVVYLLLTCNCNLQMKTCTSRDVGSTHPADTVYSRN